MLLGDSQALSLSDGFIQANKNLGLTSVVSSHSECPFILPNRLHWTYDNSACNTWQSDALALALKSKPQVVVIANRPYFNGLTENVAMLDSTGAATAGKRSQAAWVNALNGVIEPLREAGIGVVLVNPIPEADYDITLGGLIGRPDQRTTTPTAIMKSDIPRRVDAAVAAANPGTVQMNPIPSLCDQTTCPEIKNDQHLYADARHLSPPGALLLTNDLQKAIVQAMRQAPTR